MIFLAAFIAVSSSTISVERIGSLTQLSCAAPSCEGFDKLNVQPTIDWDKVKAGKETPGVDQFGGLWYFSLPAVARPNFAGYLVDGENVEVAKDAPPPKKKKKKGLKSLFAE